MSLQQIMHSLRETLSKKLQSKISLTGFLANNQVQAIHTRFIIRPVTV